MKQHYTNQCIYIAIILILIFSSCEKEDLTTFEEPKIQEVLIPETVKDTTYTDKELLKVLNEELEFLKIEEKNGIVDISHMDIVKENPKKIYVHYLPWFQSKDYDGYWGQHWTMNNQDPNNSDSDGNAQIASYYHPTIGPYSSNDPDLHEYHFLTMKLSGVDGVIFDWYGSKDLHDYGLIKQSTETFITTLEDLGLKFSIMYEDRVAKQSSDAGLSPNIIEAAQEDFLYINDTYFSSPEYLEYNNKKMLFVFGPHYITTENEWNQVFDILPTQNYPNYLTLWAASDRVGANSSGEFLWVDKDHLLAHEYYYNTYASQDKIIVGSSYPGFNSFYTEGGWSNGVNDWVINTDNGNTFVETLNYTHHEQSDFIQIITWNDFGEGTMIEPTQEFGFMYLQILQEYTGVPFTPDDLQVAVDLYNIRKKFKNDNQVQRLLNRTYRYVKKLEVERADKVLKAITRFY
ncbi:glycoside hydrolase family 71/99-like protein [Aquimarina sp. AU474]|uniref:glycoside hydrolase family 71/99-like protein n=1 Tax=Aquimarina sp. AU474 TaxID=2108529 RepID=UPI000D6933D8|nr:glycoside hydrolase family 71/99-like protein [Aquimarina sp. AU474]